MRLSIAPQYYCFEVIFPVLAHLLDLLGGSFISKKSIQFTNKRRSKREYQERLQSKKI